MTDQEIAQKFADILQDAILEIDPTINFHWQRMFGGAGYYANGRFFAAWFRGETFALKLPEKDHKSLLDHEGARDHGSYVEVAPSFLTDIPLLAEWVDKSIAYVQSLSVKKKRR
jgi:TfoX/Sxy family transcriptional regulator of competence genes